MLSVSVCKHDEMFVAWAASLYAAAAAKDWIPAFAGMTMVLFDDSVHKISFAGIDDGYKLHGHLSRFHCYWDDKI